jgi:hypothetical protein
MKESLVPSLPYLSLAVICGRSHAYLSLATLGSNRASATDK